MEKQFPLTKTALYKPQLSLHQKTKKVRGREEEGMKLPRYAALPLQQGQTSLGTNSLLTLVL